MKKSYSDYINYLEYEKKYSVNTIINYQEDIEEFTGYLEREELTINDFSYQDVRLFLMYYKNEKTYSKNSISRKLSAIRSYYKYLVNQNLIEANPFSLISAPKKDKLLPKYFESNELEELFNSCDNTPLGQRDLLILELLYATGIRVFELVNIKLTDISLSDKKIKVLGKGNKERLVQYGEYAEKALKKYLKEGREHLLKTKTNSLLLNHLGGQLTDRGVRYILDKLIKSTSLNKNISPHMLRHTFATHLLNEGCDISSVQEMLGHESIKATQIYTHVSTDRLKDIYYSNFNRAKK